MEGRRNVVWRTPSVSADGLKIFACVMMLIYNAGIVIVENGVIGLGNYTQAELAAAMEKGGSLMTWSGVDAACKLIGGLGVPVFAFLLVEGFRHTSDVKKYLLTMLVFALISEIPYDLAIQNKLWDFSSQNSMFSMTICLVMLYFLDLVKEGKGFVGFLVKLLIVLCSVVWVTIFRAQHGLALVLLTAIFYLFYARNGLKTLLGMLVSLLYGLAPLAFYGIWCYNEKRTDRFPKYAYYAFYPLHLLVMGIGLHLFF